MMNVVTLLKPCTALLLLLPVLLCFAVRVSADGQVKPAVINVACVGDSITYGAFTTNPATTSYPSVLGGWLGAGYNVQNFGVSGTTLLKKGDFPYWNTPDYSKAKLFLPNIVIIMLGTNDTKPQNWTYKDQFDADYLDLITQFRNLPSQPKIFICRPVPVIGDGNYGINEAGVLDELPIIDKVAAQKKVSEIDVYAALDGHDDCYADKVHPTDAGARLIARAVYRAITGNSPPADVLAH